MARAWFFLVLLNSSSFSATRLSISCLTCPSSSWARRTLFSSCSRVPSATSRAPCSSSFSCSRRRLCLSRSWMERPPSPSWSRRSLISSARFLFSRLTMSSCSSPSSPAAFSLKSSEVELRPSSWEAATSAETSPALDCHSPRTLSKFLPLFSVMRAAACTLSYSMARSSSSLFILVLDFSALATLVVRESTSSSLSTILACSLLRAPSSSSTRPMPSVSKRDFHSWISAWALERAFRESDFLIASFSIFSLRFSRSVALILYLVNREERSLLSASARALVSSSWVVTEILPLFMLAMAASNSSIWRERSWFSTWSLFLEDSASLRARASRRAWCWRQRCCPGAACRSCPDQPCPSQRPRGRNGHRGGPAPCQPWCCCASCAEQQEFPREQCSAPQALPSSGPALPRASCSAQPGWTCWSRPPPVLRRCPQCPSSAWCGSSRPWSGFHAQRRAPHPAPRAWPAAPWPAWHTWIQEWPRRQS